MPSTVKNPRCSLDDKRELESANNDIILAYVRAGSLYVRYQRERYLDEHPMRAGVSTLYQVGMNNQRSEEHTSELQSLMSNSYDVYCMINNKKKKKQIEEK